MPRYKITWWERHRWESVVTAKDKEEALLKWSYWDNEISTYAKETEMIENGDVKLSLINKGAYANTNRSNRAETAS